MNKERLDNKAQFVYGILLYSLLSLFAFSGSMALIVLAFFRLRQTKSGSFEDLLPIILHILVSFHFLLLISEYSSKSWDYERYQQAAMAIISGDNPYGSGYLYPPLTAQVMAFIFQVLERHPTLFGADTGLVVNTIYAAAILAVAVWFIFRFNKRENINRALVNSRDQKDDVSRIDTYRDYGHCMDAQALAPLLPRLVWEHH